jgi:hypothetical protein
MRIELNAALEGRTRAEIPATADYFHNTPVVTVSAEVLVVISRA